jgi:dihydrofolate synthase/folylpolyglutamate synthase
MTYDDCLEYLYERLPMFQRSGKAALKPDLSNTLKLLEELDNPHLSNKYVHIAGTNGKGTSAHSIASILQSAGYKTGLFTSPHLKSFTERIKINGKEIDKSSVVDFIDRTKKIIEAINPSFFEVTAAMAFYYFEYEKVDIAVIEVGLGGRLDSTNVILPEVSLITSIGMDHTDLLGNSLDKIAQEKAGIIKENVPVCIGQYQEETWPVFSETASYKNAPITLADNKAVLLEDQGVRRQIRYGESIFELDLASDYFLDNVPGIIETVFLLRESGWKIDDKAIQKGLANMISLTGLKGRFQQLRQQPLVIADISHNADGIKQLLDQVKRIPHRRLHLIYGTVKDKKLNEIIPLLNLPNTMYYFTQSKVPRSLSAKDLNELTTQNGLIGEVFENVNLALTMARKNADPEDLILVTGSTFVVAEIDDL